MKDLWWQTIGKGRHNLLLLHGWGLNAQIWHSITARLASYFTLHLVDLPGFGRSIAFDAMTLDEMTECILQQAPDGAIWLGWSFGGLIAIKAALMNTRYVQALITVSSSPCFSSQDTWPGINVKIISEFQQYLNKNLQHTIERFLILQTINTNTAQQDLRKLKNIILKSPAMKITVLNNVLELLKTIDLRNHLTKLTQPYLRIYGAFDKLVPHEIAFLLDSILPNSKSVIIKKAAHIPFISHPDEFCRLIINFSNSL